MLQQTHRRHKFSRHDRLRFDGKSYRVVSKDGDDFRLQQVAGDVLTDWFITRSDNDISDLLRSGKLAYDRDHYSRSMQFLRSRSDYSDLSDLDEDALRTIAWKAEWCARFHHRRLDPQAPRRLTESHKDLKIFIEGEKDTLDRWYLDLYGERRRAGRRVKGGEQKAFDYPSASGLRDWLRLYRLGGDRIEVFRTQYHRCGNRNQLSKTVTDVIDSCVRLYPANNRFLMEQIYERILGELAALNSARAEHDQLYVSATAVRRRIRKIDPFIFDAGRHGVKRAILKYSPIGRGLTVTEPLERIEMDDWEMDLQSLLVKTDAWKMMSPKDRSDVRRHRCTVTIAIDVATRCIVGFHLSALAPSTQNAKSALRSVFLDKTSLAKFGGCRSNWPMHGPVQSIATDGGPAFEGADFTDSARDATINRIRPDKDPRNRGTIEAFFRYFKKICRYFAGQTFKDKIELGDYQAESMASVTFEKVMRSSIQFIVDIYHHRPHRGLEGLTPYKKWKDLTDRGVNLVDNRRVTLAFSYRDERVIDEHGITCMGLSYNSDELALIRGRHGSKLISFRVNPFDLSKILVLVPTNCRSIREVAKVLGDDDYLAVDSVLTLAPDTTLEKHLRGKKIVREYAKSEELAGRQFRLAAHIDLMSAGDRARHEAGLDQFGLTQQQFTYFANALKRKGKASLSSDRYAETSIEEDDAGEVGERVDVAPTDPAHHPTPRRPKSKQTTRQPTDAHPPRSSRRNFNSCE